VGVRTEHLKERESGIPTTEDKTCGLHIHCDGTDLKHIALMRKLINIAQIRLPTQQLKVTERMEQGATNAMCVRGNPFTAKHLLRFAELIGHEAFVDRFSRAGAKERERYTQ
jgi:hypothetical protein